MSENSSANPVVAAIRNHPVMVGAAAVVLAILVTWWGRRQSPEAATAYYEVQRGDFAVTVLDRGTLAAVSEIIIRNEVEGTARIIYIVPEGTYVRKGDLLVELDSSQAQDQVNLQQIAFEKAKFALAQAEAQLDIQKSATNSDIRAAQLKVTFAKMDLDKFDEGQSMVDLIESSNKVVQAQAQLAVNRENFTWTTNLAQKGYETKQKVDVDRLAVMNNENSLVVANNTLLMLQKFDLPKQRQKFLSDYEEAKKELERVIAQSERKIAQYQADLLSQSNTLVLNEKKLVRDRKNLEATRREAPQEGLVVYAMTENRFSSESLIEEGAVVRNRQELIKLPDTSRMKVTIKVHESHVGLVQIGQPAFVKLDSMPDQRFQGTVQKVALLPDSQSRFGNPNLKVYNTEVVITDTLPGVKPGVSAQAEIVVTNISNALSVPLQAVTTLKGKQVVYVQQGSKTTPVAVQVGMFNTKFIEITSGLKEGDRVLLSPPFDTQEKDLEGAVLSAEEKAKAATNAAPARPGTSSPKSTPAPARDATNSPVTGPANRPDRSGLAENGKNSSQADPSKPANGTVSDPRRGFDRESNGQSDGGERPEGRLASSARGPGAEAGPGQGPAGMPNREEMMKQFDKDGNGELDASEREAMRAAMQARFGRAGGQGGPRLSREEMLKRFDKNGDGELDEEERTAMRESFGGSGGGARRNRGGPRPGANGEASGATNAPAAVAPGE